VTPPNVISLARVLAVPVVMALILADFDDHRVWAAAVYVLAAASDSLDGYLARSRRWASVTGAFLDPLADKLLVTGAMIALVERGWLSAWVAMAIVAREFAVTGLRMIAASGRDVIAASWPGKLKTLGQNAAVLAVLLVEGQREIVDAVVVLAILLSYWSLAGYAVRARHHFGASAAAR
jgi:CDP-diacylglycerol--glycerol-3-phosphate 3-phosphatidyltransferase